MSAPSIQIETLVGGDVARVTIDGEPYLVRWVGPEAVGSLLPGWVVSAAGSRTDRLHRNYLVQSLSGGAPKRCSCPDCVYRSSWCKHLRCVEAVVARDRELNPS